LKDAIRDKSNFDLQKAVHIFPEKIEYVKPCNYVDTSGIMCDGGIVNGEQCPQCHGTGQAYVASEQHAKRLPFPDDPADLLDLAKLTYYVERPVAISEFYRDELARQAYAFKLAVYDQEAMEKTTTVQTATEIQLDYQKIYNKLNAFAQHEAQAWKLGVQSAFEFFGYEKPIAQKTYPYDYKLKTVDELNKDLIDAKQGGQPYDVIWSIQMDIFNKQFRNNPQKIAEIQAFERWRPWKDKTPEEVALILSNRNKGDLKKVVYENFEEIREELLIEVENFALVDPMQQKRLIYEKAQSLIENIDEADLSGSLVGETFNLNG